MRDLRQYLIREEAEHAIFPQPERIFDALDETALDEVKVVIIGQDPYPERGQAHGLAFSVERRRAADVADQDHRRSQPRHGRIPAAKSQPARGAEGQQLPDALGKTGRALAEPGVDGSGRLPRRTPEQKAGSVFTDRIIEIINESREHVVFMLWGKEAKRKGKDAGIDCNRHKILTARHPRIGIRGSRHFSRANRYLENNSIDPIDWLDVCSRPAA